jgi:uncharacterized protein (DUF4415 family)
VQREADVTRAARRGSLIKDHAAAGREKEKEFPASANTSVRASDESIYWEAVYEKKASLKDKPEDDNETNFVGAKKDNREKKGKTKMRARISRKVFEVFALAERGSCWQTK